MTPDDYKNREIDRMIKNTNERVGEIAQTLDEIKPKIHETMRQAQRTNGRVDENEEYIEKIQNQVRKNTYYRKRVAGVIGALVFLTPILTLLIDHLLL